jgi:predicted nucleotide-binding protein
MPYHVRITPKSDRSHDEVKLDLTEEQLRERFVDPYYEGRPIVIGGKTIQSDDVERICITRTEETSKELLPIVRERQAGSKVVALGISDEWEVAHEGADVTDEFITGPPGSGTDSSTKTATVRDRRDVFVVHGRNLKARDSLFEFLRSINLHPIEWSQAILATGKPSPYVGEVLDAAFSMAQAVVVLMTPDDEARLREPFRKADDPPYESELTPQARPNVLFEAGMAMGRDPDRTVLVALGSLREFSDIGGRHLVRLDNSLAKRQELAQRLRNAKCDVNLEGTDWHKTGDFAVDTFQPRTEATRAQKPEAQREGGGRVFGCSQCGHGIEIYPPDSYHVMLQIDPCEQGDSQKIEVTCDKCGKRNVRYWDVYHFVLA